MSFWCNHIVPGLLYSSFSLWVFFSSLKKISYKKLKYRIFPWLFSMAHFYVKVVLLNFWKRTWFIHPLFCCFYVAFNNVVSCFLRSTSSVLPTIFVCTFYFLCLICIQVLYHSFVSSGSVLISLPAASLPCGVYAGKKLWFLSSQRFDSRFLTFTLYWIWKNLSLLTAIIELACNTFQRIPVGYFYFLLCRSVRHPVASLCFLLHRCWDHAALVQGFFSLACWSL